MDTAMLIGSRFEAGTGTEDMVLNPRTGELIVGVPEAAAEQVDRAVRAAEAAFKGWSRTTPAQRSGYLLKIAAAIEAEAPAFAALEALNCGKPINAVLNDEIPAIVDCWRSGPCRGRLAGNICRATRPCSGAIRSASSARSRRGTTR